METNQLPAAPAAPPVMDDIDFGNLIHVPRVYTASLITVNGAKEYTAKVLASIESVDIKTVDALIMEGLMEPISENRVFLAEAKTEVNEARAPHTRKMDAMKGIFIDLERDLDAEALKCTNAVKAWEAEKLRRQREANAEAEKKIQKANERANVVALVTNAINKRFAEKLIETIAVMSKAYHGKKADELEAYGKDLGEWVPELDDDTYNPIVDGVNAPGVFHTAPEVRNIINDAAGGLKSGLETEWTAKLTAERDRLVLLIPSRINELNTVSPEVAATRARADLAAVSARVNQSVEAKAEAVTQAADNARLNAVLDNAPEVTAPAGKGVKVVQKYEVKAHTAFPPIIAHWVKTRLGKLTLDEALKKLSFMITAANEDLNGKEGITLIAPGLSTVEDVTVRKTRKSATA